MVNPESWSFRRNIRRGISVPSAVRRRGGGVREAGGTVRASVVPRQQHLQDHAAARRARDYVRGEYGKHENHLLCSHDLYITGGKSPLRYSIRLCGIFTH